MPKRLWELASSRISMVALVVALTFSSVRAQESETTETMVVQSAHRLSEKCISPAGILMCTQCREQAGLAPLLTTNNADWRPSSPSDATVQWVSATLIGDEADDEDEDDGECDCEKCQHRKDKHEDESKAKHKHKHSNETPHHKPARSEGDGRMHGDRRDRPNRSFPRPNAPMPSVRPPMGPVPTPRHASPQNPPMGNPNPWALTQRTPDSNQLQRETLEVLQNINRTLHNMEAMLREDKEHRSHSPQHSYQPGPTHNPIPYGPGFTPPGPNGPGPNGPGPHNAGPHNPQAFDPSLMLQMFQMMRGQPYNNQPANHGPNGQYGQYGFPHPGPDFRGGPGTGPMPGASGPVGPGSPSHDPRSGSTYVIPLNSEYSQNAPPQERNSDRPPQSTRKEDNANR